MKFAKYTFLISGVYGLVVMLPQFFLESRIGQEQPPAITHPEFFYGFVCVTVAFQLVFLIIASDPARYRPLMPVSLVEKFPFVIAVAILYLQSRVGWQMVAAAFIDGFWSVMFLISYLKTTSAGPSAPSDAN
jgi:hypothetical protein